jgi:c-di-GMP-binding flagellar brake protein YcgR
MHERRESVRVPKAALVNLIFIVDDEEQSIEAMAVNISLTGIRLFLESPLTEGTHVSMHIHFISFDGSMKHDSIDGEIVYCTVMNNLHFIGIRFDEEIHPRKQPLLYKHLTTMISNE